MLDLRQHAVNGELVAVLAQRAGDVVLVVAGGVLLAHDGDVVVGPVDGRRIRLEAQASTPMYSL